MRKSGLPQGAWVIVADGEKALWLVNEGDDQDMNLTVRSKDSQDNPQAQDWAANRPGRMNDTGVGQRSALDDTDWHELEKERFGADLAEALYSEAHKGSFDRLVLIASRPVLSQIRADMHKEVADKIILELPKVLTNHPLDEIEELLSKELQNAA